MVVLFEWWCCLSGGNRVFVTIKMIAVLSLTLASIVMIVMNLHNEQC